MFERIEMLSRARAYEVWDAWDQERACRVILKTVRDDRRGEDAVVERLIAEGKLLESLRHPHIVRAYETIRQPEPIVVMETLSGATLSHIIDEEDPLEADEIAHLGLHLTSAIHYLHQAGYLHLDLKPSNVIGDAGRARLIDLGLAAPPGKTIPGKGTWSYLAPEQIDGHKVTAAADVWGLGAVMFDCVCGFAPFDDPAFDRAPVPAGATAAADGEGREGGGDEPDGSGGFDGEYQQLNRRARPVTEVRDTDPALAALIADCLEPGPQDRPSLTEVAERLERIGHFPEGDRRLSTSIAAASAR